MVCSVKIPSNDRGSASKPLKEVLSVHNPTLYAMALVLAMWLVSRLAVWWTFDLLQGRSFQP